MRRIRTVVVCLATVAYGAAVLVAGLDRMADTDPSLLSTVPGPVRAISAAREAELAILVGDADAAREAARTAIERDPIDARTTSLWAQAAYLTGQYGEAREGFVVSGGLGWRDTVSQLYWFQDALGRGDRVTASVRLDALLRQAPRYPQRAQLLALMESDSQGRTEIAKRLALGPAWAELYFSEVYRLGPASLSSRAAVALAVVGKGAPESCNLVAPLVGALVARGMFAEGYRVFGAACGKAGIVATPHDGDFELSDIGTAKTPFNWAYRASGSIGLSLGKAPGFRGQALRVESVSLTRATFLAQRLWLVPGRHFLSWRALDQNGEPGASIKPVISCEGSRVLPFEGKLVSRLQGLYRASVVIPTGCTGQRLDLKIEGGSQVVYLDEIRIEPLAQGKNPEAAVADPGG